MTERFNNYENSIEKSKNAEKEKEMATLLQNITEIKRLALEKFQETGDRIQAIREAVSETLGKELAEKQSEYAAVVTDYNSLFSLNETKLKEHLDDFYTKFNPVRVTLANFQEATGDVTLESPNFKESDSGSLLLIPKGDYYYLLPDYSSSFSRFKIPMLSDCFEVEFLGERKYRSILRLKNVEKPAICSKSGQAWILEEKGRLSLQWE